MTTFYKLYKNKVDIRYKKVRSLMNMSAEELKKWSKSPCSKVASINRTKVINRCIRILTKEKESWTQKDYTDAGKIISYLSRAKAITGGKPVNKECPNTTNYYALKNWAYDKKKRRRKNGKKESSKEKIN